MRVRGRRHPATFASVIDALLGLNTSKVSQVDLIVIASGAVPFNGAAECITALAGLLPVDLVFKSHSLAGLVRVSNYLSALKEQQSDDG